MNPIGGENAERGPTVEQEVEQGDFRTVFQPKYNWKVSDLHQEAFVRWIDPEEGMIYPDSLLICLNPNGFIVELDLYMFEEVCKLIERWRKGKKIRNYTDFCKLSPRNSFKFPNLSCIMNMCLKKYDIPP